MADKNQPDFFDTPRLAHHRLQDPVTNKCTECFGQLIVLMKV